jgi:mono/diheme cytochrome c family protein
MRRTKDLEDSVKIQVKQNKLVFRAIGIISASLLAFACSGDSNDDDGESPEAPEAQEPVRAVAPPPPADFDFNGEVVEPNQQLPEPTQQEQDEPANADPRELAEGAALNILQSNCGNCHGQAAIDRNAISGGMDYIEDIDALIDNNKLVPLNSAQSPIVNRMRNGTMPPAGVEQRPTDQEIDTVANFIDSVAFWPGVELDDVDCEGQEITFDDLWEDIQQDIVRVDADDREFTRYLSLSNRYNAGICADSRLMDTYRFGLSKTLNSLSTEPSVIPPEPIDSDQVLYRIDIRDYGWDVPVVVDDGVVEGGAFDDKWEAIVGLSPFAILFEGDEAEDVIDEALTDVPMIYADALVDVSTIGNLYYALVDIPATLDELLDLLQIDLEDNQDRGLQQRAGTTRSPVSRQDRTISRDPLEIGIGSFWQSFDFLANNAGESIFVNPFDGAFDNSEAVFHLNNGMLAYSIYDEAGDRLEESEILLDTDQNDFVARTMVSCSGCHAEGILEVTDEVRNFADLNRRDFDADTFELIEDLYVPKADLDRSIDQDNQFYTGALSRAGVPAAVADPIEQVFILFDSDLELADVAGDLGVTPGDLARELSGLDPELQVVDPGTIDRDDFTEIFLGNLCLLQGSSENRPNDADCDQAIDDLDL